MAAGFNKVLLMGNLTRDVEIRFTPNNQAVGNFGLAINRKYKTADGQIHEEVTFVDCEAWGKTAEVMKQYLGKGRAAFVEGRLKLDQWKDKTDGSNRSKLKVVVENFRFADSKGGPGGGGGPSSSGGGDEDQSAPAPQIRGNRTPQPVADMDSPPSIGESDIPF
jgi:single-strand DNA-binding protein